MKLVHPGVALVLMTLVSQAVQATELPATLNLGEQQLVLNGQGSRSKYLMEMYQAGLYLLEPNPEATSVIVADQLMVLRIMITSKLVSQEKLVASLDEGFNKATDGNTQPLSTQIAQFRQCFADTISRGDVFDLVYQPNQGVLVLKNGQRQGAIAGLPFKQALFGIWLGERPADAKLRQALLGTTTRR